MTALVREIREKQSNFKHDIRQKKTNLNYKKISSSLAISDFNNVYPAFVIYPHQAFQEVKSSGLYTEKYGTIYIYMIPVYISDLVYIKCN